MELTKVDVLVEAIRGGLLVNVARGGLVDYEAVINHLESGHLGGLGTDVAWTEPFNPDDQIFKFKNVIMTPHVAGVTEHSYRSMAKAVGDVVLQLHAGLPLTGIELVN
ncbi:Glyoxylate reductase [Glycine soja]|uniref:Glyoxylate reductase n=1 Tax=Glycine soja TaxID=3848 RepID=A0A445KYN9_GLYSO|nr:Glyoxylate reductase [Glycine soja]